ncbi:MAG: hypothetical protein INR71_02080 [Terriglobus roseus]|nr:hypothetical protein [Terriglobus roseus]
MNHWASSSRKTIFTSTVICVRMIFGKEVGLDDKADEIVGVYIMMGPKLKKRVGGGNEVVADMKSEEERVRALKDHFDIELAPADEAAIVGLPSAIVATAEP